MTGPEEIKKPSPPETERVFDFAAELMPRSEDKVITPGLQRSYRLGSR